MPACTCPWRWVSGRGKIFTLNITGGSQKSTIKQANLFGWTWSMTPNACMHGMRRGRGGRDVWWRTADADPIIDPVLLIQMRRSFQFFAPIFASWTAEDKKERDDYRHRVKLEMYFQGWWIINDCNESNDCKGSLFKVLLSCAMAYSAPSWNPFIVNHEKTLSAMQHRRVTN